MSTQSPLPGMTLRDAAIDRVEEHADQEWRDAATLAVEACALTRRHFTSDHVWQHMVEADVTATTHEPRAMGAIMRAASNAGWCERTDVTKNSTRPQCHRRPLRVWRSLIHPDVIDKGSK